MSSMSNKELFVNYHSAWLEARARIQKLSTQEVCDVLGDIHDIQTSQPFKVALLHPENYHRLCTSLHKPSRLKEFAEIQNRMQGPQRFPAAPQDCPPRCQRHLWRPGDRCSVANGLQQDHILPYAHGGPTLLANRSWLCAECNGAKSDALDSVWMAVSVESWIYVQLGNLRTIYIEYLDDF